MAVLVRADDAPSFRRTHRGPTATRSTMGKRSVLKVASLCNCTDRAVPHRMGERPPWPGNKTEKEKFRA
jgi:hypothetical protein